MLELFATKFECYGDGETFVKHDCVFTVEVVDDCVCGVTIKQAVSAADWPEVSEAIHAALRQATKPLAVAGEEDGGEKPPDKKNKDDSIPPIIFKEGSHIFLEDISANCLEDISANGYVDLIATRTHVLNVYMPKVSTGMYGCVYAPWALNAFATSHDGLIKYVKEQIGFLWRTYVREEDGKLSAPGITIKQQLIEDWEEVEIVNEP